MKKTLLPFIILLSLISAQLSAQTEVKMNAAEKKKFNTFFSNFSESNLNSFSKENLADSALIDFALRHCYLNKFKSLEKSKDGTSVIVPAKLVDEVTTKYFGKNAKDHGKAPYSVPLADGEGFTFSQIKSLKDLGQDQFQAAGTIYSTGSGGTPDPHGTPEEWKKAGEEVSPSGDFSALIKKEKGDKEHFTLLEYTVTEKASESEPSATASATASAPAAAK